MDSDTKLAGCGCGTIIAVVVIFFAVMLFCAVSVLNFDLAYWFGTGPVKGLIPSVVAWALSEITVPAALLGEVFKMCGHHGPMFHIT